MKLKIKSKVISFRIILIAFYLQIQSMSAYLPSKDLLSGAFCTRSFIGEDFIKEYFTNEIYMSDEKEYFLSKDDNLFDGEYMGVLCENYRSNWKIINELVEAATEKGNENDIESCLAKNGNVEVFEKFNNIYETAKYKVLETLERELSFKSSQNSEKNGLSFPNSPNSEHDTLSTKSSQNSDEDKQSTKSLPESNEEQQKKELKKLSMMKFITGICESEEIEQFHKLKTQGQQTEAFQCLGKCADKFIRRTEFILKNVQLKAITLLENKATDLRQRLLRSRNPKEDNAHITELERKIKNLKQKQYFEIKPALFLDSIKNSKSEKNVDLVTRKGKVYFDKYDPFYDKVNRYLPDMEKHSDITLKNMDKNLNSIYSIYIDCGDLQCGIAGKSIPLCDFIEDGIKNEYSKDAILLRRLKTTVKQVGIYKFPTQRQLFRAMVLGDKKDTNTVL